MSKTVQKEMGLDQNKATMNAFLWLTRKTQVKYDAVQNM